MKDWKRTMTRALALLVCIALLGAAGCCAFAEGEVYAIHYELNGGNQPPDKWAVNITIEDEEDLACITRITCQGVEMTGRKGVFTAALDQVPSTGIALSVDYTDEGVLTGVIEASAIPGTGIADLASDSYSFVVPYTVTLGGNPTSYTSGDEIALRDPSRKDYTFMGWYESPSFSGSPVTGISADDWGDKTFYAKWEATRYDVAIDAACKDYIAADRAKATVGETVTITVTPPQGQMISSMSVTRGQSAVSTHWEGSNTFTFTMPSGDVSVTAAFVAGRSGDYVDENGNLQHKNDAKPLTGSVDTLSGWYVVSGIVTFYEDWRPVVNGSATLILCDGALLSIPGGIYVGHNATLTIYGQGAGTGKLTVDLSGKEFLDAGIGGNSTDGSGAKIVINGGTVVAYGSYGAGIGGGRGGGATVTINGGTVTATSGRGAGIGSGEQGSGSVITITGGTVNASSSSGGAGIGGSYQKTGGYGDTITITGGTVTASSTLNGAGIGSGEGGMCGSITISGGNVTATGNNDGAGIGTGSRGSPGSITISGGTVSASTNGHSAGIGGCAYGSGSVTITGGNVTAHSSAGAGIGGGGNAEGSTSETPSGTVVISGGTVTATSSRGAGIGGGSQMRGGNVTIAGGQVTASSSLGAGIGSGHGSNSTGGNITITGGQVTTSSSLGAGIGGGREGSGGTIQLSLSRADEFILSSGYFGTVTIPSGKWLGTDGAFFTGTLSSAQNSAISGKKLTTHNIFVIGDTLHGTVVPSKYLASAGETVSLTVIPKKYCALVSLTVTDGSGNAVAVTDNTFIMPQGFAMISAQWRTSSFPYLDEHGERRMTAGTMAVVTEETQWNGAVADWWIIADDVTLDDRVIVTGTVNLLLCDGATLTANNGIDVAAEGNTLNIYAQSTGSGAGTLNAIAGDRDAAIGSSTRSNCGTININGGNINAENRGRGAGIGGSEQYDGGTITINAGTVNASSWNGGAGIGGGNGGSGGTITINGGTVTAFTRANISDVRMNGAGIGGGVNGGGGTITINGGTVTATSCNSGAGIGGGGNVHVHGSVTINGGTVTATSGNEGAGIGNGLGGSNCSVTITGGRVTASSPQGAGIGGDTAVISLKSGDDFIRASSYSGTVTVPDGKCLGGDGVYCAGTLTDGQKTAAAGKKLVIPNVVILHDGQLGYAYASKHLAAAGEPISLTAEPLYGCELGSFTVADGSGQAVAVTDNTFIMPEGSAVVTAHWQTKPYTYLDEHGARQRVGDSRMMVTTETEWNGNTALWWIIDTDVTLNSRVTVTGTVNLLLCDGATLMADTGGICVNAGNTLNIYAQSTGSGAGSLRARATTETEAGIGGNEDRDCGTVNICGGNLVAIGPGKGAGIGGGIHGACGTITIYGGDLYAVGTHGAAIGSGCMEASSTPVGYGTISIYDGTILAVGVTGAAIGGGMRDPGPTITIAGGVITAKSYIGNAIGYGDNVDTSYYSNSRIIITGGQITADGGSAIGGCFGCNEKIDIRLNRKSDFVIAKDYNGPVTITDGQYLKADNVSYTGTLTSGEISAIRGKMLVPDRNIFVINDADWAGIVVVKKDWAAAGETVVMTIANDHAYELQSLTVTDFSGNAVTVTDNTFVMPEGSVTIRSQWQSSYSYLDVDGEMKRVTGTRAIVTDKTDWNGNETLWQIVDGDVTLGDRVTVTGTVNLLLCDGATLTASGGICVGEGNTLNIYAQSTGSGAGVLNASAGSSLEAEAGIGGNQGLNCGTVTIIGGNITAQGGSLAAGIGGGREGDGGSIAIYGGSVAATGGDFGAGIGGGCEGAGGSITIYGGSVAATGGWTGAGIGSGKNGSGGGSITIYGGSVTATGGKFGAGIGGGAGSGGGTLTITGGNITATGNNTGAGIGGDGSSTGGGTASIRLTNESDYVQASGYTGTVTITGGQYLKTEDASYTGQLTDEEISAISGKKLVPDRNVVINSDPQKGTVTSDKAWALPGEVITLTIVPAEDLELASLTVADSSGNAVTLTDDTFIMPEISATVTAQWQKTYYYLDTDGEMKRVTGSRTMVTSQSPWNWNGNDSLWWIVDGDAARGERTTITGTVNLLLCDGATLTANGGICVNEGNTLNIYAQSTGGGAGVLNASADILTYSGIGGNQHKSCGTVNIIGGNVTATGSALGAGIGGGQEGNGGSVAIYGGAVTAISEQGGAGIGGGYRGNGGSVVIYGGTVSASSGLSGAGIGSGGAGSGSALSITSGTVAIHGGAVTASSSRGAGIGGGNNIPGAEVTITGGMVDAASSLGAGIGGGESSTGGTASIRLTNESDYVQSSGYTGTVTIAGGQYLKTEDESFTGTLTDEEISAISGKKLVPDRNVVINSDPQAGTVTASKAWALPGDVITLTIVPEEESELISLAVTDAWGNAVTLTDDNTFIMPEISATATFQWQRFYRYLDVDGELKRVTGSQTVVTDETEWNGSDSLWWIIDHDVTLDSRVTVTGTVNLLLCDGVTLTAEGGINSTDGNTLNIYAHSAGDGAGVLIAGGAEGEAAIGGNQRLNCGTVNIIGGNITATGGYLGAGIGGGYGHSGGSITIYGGSIAANGGDNGAGIGGGDSGIGGSLTINGGDITATGGYAGAGIGGGFTGAGGTVTINGGNVAATGGSNGAGIGGGFEGDAGTIIVSGGTVAATASDAGAGIGGGWKGNGGSVTISGGTVTAISSKGAGIGSGDAGTGTLELTSGTVTIHGGAVTASSSRGAGIGGGRGTPGAEVTITGGTVDASSSSGAGIGGGLDVTGGGLESIGGGTARISLTLESDYVQSSGYTGTVTITGGQYLKAEDESYTGQLTDEEISAISGKKLVPDRNVIISGNPQRGAVTASKAWALPGDVITLTIVPAEKCELSSLAVADAAGLAVTLTDNSFVMPEISAAVTAEFRLLEPRIAGYRLRLSGVLGLDYYVELPEDFDGTGAQMVFTVDGKQQTIPFDQAASQTLNGVEYKVFPCSVYAYLLAEDITAEFTYGQGKTLNNTYSVQQYLDAVQEGDYTGNAKGLVEAIRCYGHYMQIYIEDIHPNVRHPLLSYDGGLDVEGAVAGAANYKHTITARNTDKVDRIQYNLIVSSDTCLNVNLRLDQGVTGEMTAKVNGKNADITMLGSVYRISVGNISARNLQAAYPFSFYLDGQEIFSMTASVLSYVDTMLNQSTNEIERNAMAALYHYYVAAEAYAKHPND